MRGEQTGTMTDPYALLGLVGNPFVAESSPGVADEVFCDVGLPPPPQSGVVELVGCKGAGKTTHLLRWIRRVGGRYVHVDPGMGRLRWLPVAPVVAWDEVDRVPPPILAARVAAARRRRGLLLLGTHVPTGLADISHRLPSPTAASVQSFAARRIAAALLPGAATTIELEHRAAAEIAAESGGCWWSVGTALHVWAAQVAAR